MLYYYEDRGTKSKILVGFLKFGPSMKLLGITLYYTERTLFAVVR